MTISSENLKSGIILERQSKNKFKMLNLDKQHLFNANTYT